LPTILTKIGKSVAFTAESYGAQNWEASAKIGRVGSPALCKGLHKMF